LTTLFSIRVGFDLRTFSCRDESQKGKGMEMRARKRLLTFAMPLAILAGSCWGALADDDGHHGGDRDRPRGDEQLTLKKTIDVRGNGLGAFDISFVDPSIELYVLADRTNASVDLIDSEAAQFLGRVGSTCPSKGAHTDFCFQGVVTVNGKVNNALSGPDGVVVTDHKEVWAGDGDSKIKVIDLATKQFVTTISTGGKFRVDEMAYDPRDHLLAAANNADTPPFITVFDTVHKTIVGKIVFDGTKGTPNAPGIEQPQWSPATGLFYVSVPVITQADPNDASIGGVSVIDPSKIAVLGTFLVKDCGPNGLALGPRHEALLGCGSAFGTPPTTKSVIIDITATDFTLDGAVVATVPIGGSDEVWYDPGTRHYFLAADNNNNAAGVHTPILGVIDAVSNRLDPSVPSSTTSHSVAADKDTHLVFLPVGLHPSTSTTPDPNNVCPKTGCIAVYKARSEHHHDDSDRFADR
jgi:hypothetical protein